jgi:hypothetical protein
MKGFTVFKGSSFSGENNGLIVFAISPVANFSVL